MHLDVDSLIKRDRLQLAWAVELSNGSVSGRW